MLWPLVGEAQSEVKIASLVDLAQPQHANFSSFILRFPVNLDIDLSYWEALGIAAGSQQDHRELR